MHKIYIDGQLFHAGQGESVLQVARRNGLTTIPALCYHPALEVAASCRMCVVEVEAQSNRLVTACTLKAQGGLCVRTDSPAVRVARKNTLSLLLKRSPDSSLLQEWAKIYSPNTPREIAGVTAEHLGCIQCGLCVRACAVLGIEALQFVGKGKDRQVKFIVAAAHSPCIGCGACEWLCTSQGMQAETSALVREITGWKSNLPEAICTGCGRVYATQAAVNFVRVRVPAAKARIGLCPECKRVASIPFRLRR